MSTRKRVVVAVSALILVWAICVFLTPRTTLAMHSISHQEARNVTGGLACYYCESTPSGSCPTQPLQSPYCPQADGPGCDWAKCTTAVRCVNNSAKKNCQPAGLTCTPNGSNAPCGAGQHWGCWVNENGFCEPNPLIADDNVCISQNCV